MAACALHAARVIKQSTNRKYSQHQGSNCKSCLASTALEAAGFCREPYTERGLASSAEEERERFGLHLWGTRDKTIDALQRSM